MKILFVTLPRTHPVTPVWEMLVQANITQSIAQAPASSEPPGSTDEKNGGLTLLLHQDCGIRMHWKQPMLSISVVKGKQMSWAAQICSKKPPWWACPRHMLFFNYRDQGGTQLFPSLPVPWEANPCTFRLWTPAAAAWACRTQPLVA